MARILPAGQHYGTMLTKWSSSALTVCRIRYSRNSSYDVHGNEQASVVFVERGQCSKRFGQKTMALSRGSMLLIPPERLQADAFPVTTRFLAAEVTPRFLQGIHDAGVKIDEVFQFSNADAADFSSRLLLELCDPDSFSELVFEGILMNLFVCGYRATQCHDPKPASWLLRARDLLHDRAFESLHLHEIAREVEVHPAQLSRDFKRVFGTTPGEYLRRLRLEFAVRQLGETELTLAEIATAAGFADQAHFSRTFRRYKRMPPSEYRSFLRRE
ncbi:MAG TPA: AraC family transcriptional regulator [Candidatus Sulfotelmatobacter sp.]|nr:AraC family transcriptional regulator [Candidatus Sulfotelmatobacter sp.]